MKYIFCFLVILTLPCNAKLTNNKEDPGKCNSTTTGETTIVNGRDGNERVLICVRSNGKYIWRELDSFPTLGEFFNPAEDCSDIVQKQRDAKSGFYWIKGLGLKRLTKVWCDVSTDGGGFMLVGYKNSPVSWTLPSNPKIVSPQGHPHWSSKFGNVQMLEFRIQVSTTNNFNNSKADWLYRFTSSRRLTELLMSDKGGCTSHYPGVGQIEYVKDLLAGEIVTRNFQCSRFGPAYPPGLGWKKMNKCLEKPCKAGFAVFPGSKSRYDSYGAFSFSTNSQRSGVIHNSTVFIGCEHGKCCACFGPKGRTGDFCSPGCRGINGGTVTNTSQAWFWIRSSVPTRPVWKKCTEYEVQTREGKTETHFVDEKTGVSKKGSCESKGVPNLVSGVVEVSDKKALDNVPQVEGLMTYRKDDEKLYVTNGNSWQALGREKQEKALENKLKVEKKNISRIASVITQLTNKYENFEKKFQVLTPLKLVSINVISEGCQDPGKRGSCGEASIYVNGHNFAKKIRGYNIVTMNGATGKVNTSVSFDTYASSSTVTQLKQFLSGLSMRTLVLIAIQDDGSKRMITSAYDALINIGVDNPLRNSFQSSFAYVGWIGVKQRKRIEQVQNVAGQGPSSITTTIMLP